MRSRYLLPEQTSYTYSPYGETTATGTASNNTSQYTGRENDNDGLYYYYRARYYHPVFSRFVSEDPIGFSAGDPGLYRCVFDSPTNFNDPSGKFVPLLIGAAFVVWTLLDAHDMFLSGRKHGRSDYLLFFAGITPFGKAAKIVEFALHPKVVRQLLDPRLQHLAGRLDDARLNQLINNPSALRLWDTASGHINVIQNVEGITLRITSAADAMRIISVGPIRMRGVINGIDKGRYVVMR